MRHRNLRQIHIEVTWVVNSYRHDISLVGLLAYRTVFVGRVGPETPLPVVTGYSLLLREGSDRFGINGIRGVKSLFKEFSIVIRDMLLGGTCH